MRLLAATAAAVLIILIIAWLMPTPGPPPPPEGPPADYLGSAQCAQCHPEQYEKWRRSAHALTLQPALDSTVLGEFVGVEPVTFKELTVQPAAWEDYITLKDGQVLKGTILNESASEVVLNLLGEPQVVPRKDIASIERGSERRRRAQGRPDAGASEYKMIVIESRGEGMEPVRKKYTVDYVLGRGRQIQEYLTLGDDGRLQVLPLVWDTRRKLWYDHRRMLPKANEIGPDNPYYWTGYERTANLSCLSCHVNQLVSNYDPRTDTYRSTWLEPGVGCESCHGPGRTHVEAARRARETGSSPADWGVKSLRTLSARARTHLCAQCHSLRLAYGPNLKPGEDYYDRFVPLLWNFQGRFLADGTPIDDNYQYLSLLQSRCARAGDLTCADCHDPHQNDVTIGRNRSPQSDKLCTRCHQDIARNLTSHTHHPADSPGSRCLNCHMPRLDIPMGRCVTDHRITVPNPEATVALEIPNACSNCHRTETPRWAARRFTERYGHDPRGLLARTLTLTALSRGEARAVEPGLRLLTDPRESPPLRAAVATLLGPAPQPRVQQALLETALGAHPLVQVAAITALSKQRVRDHTEVVTRLLGSLTGTVRLAAANRFVQDPDLIDRLDPKGRRLLRQVLQDAFSAALTRREHPDWATYLARIDWARGRGSQAIRRLRLTLEKQPDYVPARVSLAEFYLIQQRFEEALVQYQALGRLRPEDLAAQVGMAQCLIPMGRAREAVAILEGVLKSAPGFIPAHLHLGLAYRALGETEQAAAQWREVLRLDPGNPVASALLAEVAGGKP